MDTPDRCAALLGGRFSCWYPGCACIIARVSGAGRKLKGYRLILRRFSIGNGGNSASFDGEES